MSYYVEISYDIRKHNCSDFKNKIADISITHNSYRAYEDYEISGLHRTIKRNHCVMTFVFHEEDIIQIEKFLRKMKKISKLYVECIYTDYHIIFASKNYQRMFPNFNKEQLKVEHHEEGLLENIKKNY